MLRFEDLTDLAPDAPYLIIINTLTGLNRYGDNPNRPEVKVVFPSLRSNESPLDDDMKDFVSLFITMPPFEPLPHPRIWVGDVEFQGVYVWFIEPAGGELFRESEKDKILRYAGRRDVRSYLEEYTDQEAENDVPDVVLGTTEKGYFSDSAKLLSVIPINILTLRDDSLKIYLTGEGSGSGLKTVQIEYGARYLSWLIRRKCGKSGIARAGNCIKEIDKWLRQTISGSGSRMYYIGSLNYITYCHGGRYVTTDPIANKLGEISKITSRQGIGRLDPVCPACRGKPSRYNCKSYDGYRWFHYSRKVFPNVYPKFKQSIAATWPASKVAAPFDVRLAKSMAYIIKVEELSMILPNSEALKIRPKKKPFTELRRTNGVVVLINEDFVKALLSFIYSARKGGKLFFTVPKGCMGGKWPLYDVLYAKYLQNKYGGVFGVDYRVEDGLPKLVIRGSINWVNLWKMRSKDPLDPGLVRFVGQALSHTLAHVLVQKIAEVLGISMSNLLYIYDYVDEGVFGRYYVSGVFEYNKAGVLQLDSEIAEYVRIKYGETDVKTALKRFVADAVLEILELYKNMPSELRDDRRRCTTISKQIDELVDSYSVFGRDLVDNIRKIIEEFIRGFAAYLDGYGIGFDFTTFKYIVEKAIHAEGGVFDVVMRYVRKNVRDEGARSQLRQFVNEVTDLLIEYYAPPICMDGCSYDIFLERHCTESIFENITTSRELLRAFAVVSGIVDAGTLTVSSDSLYNLVRAARKKLDILTAFTSTNMIDALKGIIDEKKRKNLAVSFILSRSRADERSLIEEIKRAKDMFPGRLEFRLTDRLSHEKGYVVDDIEVTTSWNFTSPNKKKDETVSFHYRHRH